jgi:erythromycin esterase-like protein
MKRVAAYLVMLLCTICLAQSVAAAAKKTPAMLEQEYQTQNNPRKQADIARKLLALRLEELRARIDTGQMLEESTPELAHYQAAVKILGAAVRKAAHTGTSKNAEKELRDQSHELDNLKIMVSSKERPLVNRLLTQVSDLRDKILYGLMLPPPEEAESARK